MTAVVQLHLGQGVAPEAIKAFVKARIGSVKTPKQVEIWPDLPRSKLAEVLKKDTRARLLGGADGAGRGPPEDQLGRARQVGAGT